MFPAPAGINRTLTQRANILTGVPRASGDKPEPNSEIQHHFLCSPRQRG
ncbi:hypothetical protein ECP02999175_3067 [Escherichia coli P0299917.5]|uniref:Uncharacterized protein n=1 Tax=Escherichia coli 2-460-02_S1_C1 TaxID=1444044 RepID=A0A836ZBY4_ECOLX|nr:hypothetical protein predicted by Glimmer/Critica [Escherichia coli H591]EGW81226.1 hypothetical protein ECSTEC94C_3231 [Escherichia coli STEC_94C]EMW40785.1 hypothetical protein EC2788150_2981 [Escherichia coli 2788150]EMX14122.1 hypothetical protein ECP03022932_3082 [Escherichia coli P0302293.2]ENC39386.1 hypothetical protein ECP029991710_3104 [Escherichia coli P0299917.10]ENC45906.1 hypothetical protein ECP02999172_3155 [Escherichia coli P0299917.2]ENC53596.1 hypothetical protein ECP029